jgi:hypothetical protein
VGSTACEIARGLQGYFSLRWHLSIGPRFAEELRRIKTISEDGVMRWGNVARREPVALPALSNAQMQALTAKSHIVSNVESEVSLVR